MMIRTKERAFALLRLVDVPEQRGRGTVEHAGQRFTPAARQEILPQRDVDHLLIGFLLDVSGDLLLIVERGGANEVVLELFVFGVADPPRENVLLVYRQKGSTAHFDIIERRIKEVHPAERLETERVRDLD